MSELWFTSDQHFWHKNVITYCNRPWQTIEEMNEGLIKNWNEVVKETDVVYILGDFSFSKPSKTNKILDQLNGTKRLIKGNHDHSITKWHCELAVQDHIFSLDMIFPEITKIVTLCHYPFAPIDADEDVRFLERRPTDYGQWLLHGHVHQTYKIRRKMINVGVDVWNYYPVNYDVILELITPAPLNSER